VTRRLLASVIAFAMALLALAGVVVAQAGSENASSSSTPTTATTIEQAATESLTSTNLVAPPTVLHVDTWGTDHVIVPVGLTGDGALVPPADLQQVGWWQDGATPSDGAGTVVLTSHRDSSELGQGPFAQLENLPLGSVIHVDGAPYVLSSLDTYAKDTLPTQHVFAQDGPARLVIVTCGGTFTGHHWDSNIVGTFLPA
jgi:hypothetical protein